MENATELLKEIKNNTSNVESELSSVNMNTTDLDKKLDIIIELLQKIVDR